MSADKDIIRKKNTGEPGNRGEFGATSKPASGLSLDDGPQEQTWTFIGHWEDDEIVVDDVVPGIVMDDREEEYEWEQGLFAAPGTGPDVLAAEEAVRAEYEPHYRPRVDMDTALAGLSPQDRRLAEALLDPDNYEGGRSDAGTREDVYKKIQNFDRGAWPTFDHEVQQTGAALTNRRRRDGGTWEDTPNVDITYSVAGVPQGYEVSVPIGDGFAISVDDELCNATTDRDAVGLPQRLAIARVLEAQMDRVAAKAATVTAAPPTTEQMRAAVTIADWKSADQPVVFADGEDGVVQEGHIRGGRYASPDGVSSASPGCPDNDTYVRFTMSSGTERFIPFARVQEWVLEGRIGTR